MVSIGEGEPHFFRNLCRDFRKIAIHSKDPNEILEQTERFINACHDISWPHEHTETYRKDAAEKATQKVVNEAKRFMESLQKNPTAAVSQDLVDALTIVEKMASEIRFR